MGTGRYRCHPGHGVDFVIADGIVTDFNAVTAVDDPDMARGYTVTCRQHIGKFYQTIGGKNYVLQVLPTQNQFGESEDCQVHIESFRAMFHIRTSNCRSECMDQKECLSYGAIVRAQPSVQPGRAASVTARWASLMMRLLLS